MHLKQFEAGRYDDDHIIVRNPSNESMELFTESEFEIAKFLKQNEKETLLALLLPNIGIAKKDHILLCLKVLAKLKRMQIVDYFSIIGKFTQSNTGTIELETRKKIKLDGIKTFVSFIYEVFDKIFSLFGTNFLLLLTFALCIFSVTYFPIKKVESELSAFQFSYWSLFLVAYLSACAAFSFRAIFQSAYLRAAGREMKKKDLGMHFPFLCLTGNTKDVWMMGFQARLQLDVLSLFAPLAFSALFTALFLFGCINPLTAFVGFSSSVAVCLIVFCPIFSFDFADFLHVLFQRDLLLENVSQQMKEVFRNRGKPSKAVVLALLFTLFWLFVWLDFVRAFWEMISAQVVADLQAIDNASRMFGSGTMILALAAMIIAPVLIFIVNLLREKFKIRGKRLIITSARVKDSLTFEERMSALEKIPLFAYLNDQERLALLNQMSIVYFDDGAYLVHQGEVGKEFLVLVKGRAQASYTDSMGRHLHLANLQEGDAFGEIALIDDVPRTASIISDGGCIALVLKKEGFDKFSAGLGTSDRVKTMIRLTSFFRRHPLFSKLSAKDQAKLIDSFSFQTLMTGEEIVGAESDENFYVIYSGKVRVDTGDDSSEAFLEPDDCFGYTKALRAKYYALEGTGLLSVPTELFHSLIWEKLVEKPELFL